MPRKIVAINFVEVGLYLFNPDSIWMINIRLKNLNIKHVKSATCIFIMKACYLSLDSKLDHFILISLFSNC